MTQPDSSNSLPVYHLPAPGFTERTRCGRRSKGVRTAGWALWASGVGFPTHPTHPRHPGEFGRWCNVCARSADRGR